MNSALLLSLLGAAFFIVRRYIEYQNALKSVRSFPGFRTVLSVSSVLSNAIPRIPYVAMGKNWQMQKYRYFEQYGVDVITGVSVLPKVKYSFQVADPQAIKEIVGSRSRFPKPVQQYTLLLFFGKNIVASEHEEWKKYRKISQPAFTERNNKLVWDETISIMNDLFDNVWGAQKKVVEVEHALDITMPLALFVIGAAGFGRRIGWEDEMSPPAGHKLSFKDTLYTVSNDVIIKALIPDWAMSFNKRFAKAKLAFEELEAYMLEMIEARKSAEVKESRSDLLTSLIEASDDGYNEDIRLTIREVLGNIFIFLIAGHETTAHTLCFAMALLALYPAEQERAYEEIKQHFPDGSTPTIDDLPKLSFVESVINEALRMFPPVTIIPKMAADDTTLPTTTSSGEKLTVAIPKGSPINIHTPGLHYNPRYWKDPEQFNPSRFLGDWPRDAFLPFSGGVRSCLGRQFAELESIIALTMILSKYKMSVKEEPQFAHETFEQKRDRVLFTKPGLTLTPVRVPLVFTKRDAL